ncbi:hypothetical protein KHA96_18425 [Bacillus sp. FJAT-49711]|uniref:hypothetical protein n=1 Tax=Bacillus sp. FJAT-49711 TaxID=2833585 RepID=UPI001BC940A1|nr:hypothetical protein [Bacillus sp. FJAT-49711]MBS4220281.1 hypothetical protein [Bacillus sp. FJAT-49711]
MSGRIEILPKKLITKVNCTADGIDTDIDTGLYLLQLILADHKLFLSPHMVAVDRLLAEAIKLHWDTIPNKDHVAFPRLTDSDVLSMLTGSRSNEARKLINTILYEPYNIQINDQKTGSGYPISIRKVYSRLPTCNGRPITEYSHEANVILQKLSELSFDLEVIVES